MSPTWCVKQSSSSFRPSIRTHRIMGSWCSSDTSDTPWVNEDFRIKRISLGHYIPKRPCFLRFRVFFVDIGEPGKGSGKHAGVVFRICGVTNFHRVPRGFSQGNPPRLPILRISCQNSPMRNLTAILCLTVAVLLGSVGINRVLEQEWCRWLLTLF